LASIKNPLLIVFLGALLTAIIQSSSVLTSIAITMVVAGLLSLNQGIYLTMGSNIGSCVVAIMAGMTSGRNAKRTALIHLFFNVMGVVLFLLIALLLHLFTKGDWSFGKVFEILFPHAPQVQLAMFHTVFNVCTTLVALPMTEALVRLVCRIIPDHVYDHKDDKFHLHFLDDSMLATPALEAIAFHASSMTSTLRFFLIRIFWMNTSMIISVTRGKRSGSSLMESISNTMKVSSKRAVSRFSLRVSSWLPSL
ncbi:MAG: Na/Pi cotransporter family protein, partial [Bacteroidaceae bacterium]|nr:Na/Pi cotransporter family protein [Bacteroidaceae bacterium]